MTQNEDWAKHNRQRNRKWLKHNIRRLKKMSSVKKRHWLGLRLIETTLINSMRALVFEAETDEVANTYKTNFDRYFKLMEAPDSEYVSRAEIRHWNKKLINPVVDYLHDQKDYVFRHAFKRFYTVRGVWIGALLWGVGVVKMFNFPWLWYYSLFLVIVAFLVGSLMDFINVKKV
ncbi:hypothetical protein [uncultured Microscilla sp.]|uniref:hypothetical protein n=1 Tax=uncultured Microscilla sp. TaxID=432653 RepID=UPI00262FB3D1|nr:hypothetical protein [uncultured Microscilla sp.]